MRRVALVAGSWLFAGAVLASEAGPVIVIPSSPGIPISVFGQDISYAVVEGDWGLDRPGNINPTIIYRPWQPRVIGPVPAAAYYPKTGRKPKVGRLERDVPTKQPRGAQSYNRGWGVQSDPTPVTIPPAEPPPPIVVAPDLHRRRP
jgi:hypothetical protein